MDFTNQYLFNLFLLAKNVLLTPRDFSPASIVFKLGPQKASSAIT